MTGRPEVKDSSGWGGQAEDWAGVQSPSLQTVR